MQFFKIIYSFFVDTIQTLLLALSIFLVIYAFFGRPFQVSGESMYPTFKNREYILTNLIGVRFGEIERGDVIVFKAPNENNKDFIKRVIGVPGDEIVLQDGYVFVNNKKLEEGGYLGQSIKTYGGSFLHEGEKVILPTDKYFVMGDNRPFSSDSREWGLLDKSEIIGKSFYVYWPVTEMRSVGANPYTDK